MPKVPKIKKGAKNKGITEFSGISKGPIFFKLKSETKSDDYFRQFRPFEF
jgi:hypothetical protein